MFEEFDYNATLEVECRGVRRQGATKTSEQLAAAEKGPVTIEADGKEYLLIAKESYQRVSYDDSEMTHDEMMELLAQSAEANGWNEPGMDDYDRYDEMRVRE